CMAGVETGNIALHCYGSSHGTSLRVRRWDNQPAPYGPVRGGLDPSGAASLYLHRLLDNGQLGLRQLSVDPRIGAPGVPQWSRDYSLAENLDCALRALDLHREAGAAVL